ncbi:MAG: hypothetical protein KAR07_09675 [Spirochaetes bacterium]|nr:hypothetical protein [Spirochaetota bacterium]
MKNKLLQTSLMEKSGRILFFRSETHALIKMVILVLMIILFTLSMNQSTSSAEIFKISVIAFAAVAFLLMGIKHNAVIDTDQKTLKTEKNFFFIKKRKEFNIDKNSKVKIESSGKTNFLNLLIKDKPVFIASSRDIDSLEKWNNTINELIQNLKK